MASRKADSPGAGETAQLLTFVDVAQALQDPGADITVDVLKKALVDRIPALRACGEPDPAPSATAKSKLQSASSLTYQDGSTVPISDAGLKTLASDFAVKLVLDEMETALLLRVYTQRHDVSDLDKLSVSQKDELCDRLTEFHFEERLAKTRCILHLFLIAESDGHVFQEAALGILASLLDDGFGARCVRTYTASTKRLLPPHVRNITAYASFWATQLLKEQLAILELALTFFRNRPAQNDNVLSVVDACRETSIGRIQASQGYFPVTTVELQTSIRFTLVLITVVTLDLDTYSRPINLASSSASNSASTTTKTLADDPALLRRAVDFLDFDEPDLLQGPLMLCWALVIQSIEDALVAQRVASGRNVVPEHLHDLEDALEREHAEPLWTKLADMALHPDTGLFECLQAMAASPLLAALPVHPDIALAPSTALHYRTVLKRLVLTSVQLVRPEYLPDFEVLVAVLETICAASADSTTIPRIHPELAAALPKLCLQFWLSDLGERQGEAIMDTARSRWPASFRPLLRLLRTFSGAARSSDGTPSSPDAVKAATESLSSTISDFVNLSSLTFPLPPNNIVTGAYWRVISGGPDGAAVYEAVQDVPVLGRHVVPAGSQGRLVSKHDSAVTLARWTLDQPISGWVLLRDMLSELVPEQERRLVRTSQAVTDDVFEQRDKPFQFFALASDSAHESMEDIVSDSLDLFGVALSSAQTARALLEHLNASSEPPPRTLSSITISILLNALQNEPTASRCITSAYQLLTALVPHEQDTIWALLRASHLLPSQATALQSRSLYGSAAGAAQMSDHLLASNIRAGSFSATLAMLDSLIALVAELRSSHLATDVDALEARSGKLAESVQWVFARIWTQFNSWAYQQPYERLLLAERCVSLFESILDDPSLQRPTSATFPLAQSVERLFIAEVDVNAIRPLLVLINGGHALLSGIDSADKLQTSIIERALTVVLSFSTLIIEHTQRRRGEQFLKTSPPGLLVLAFFESGGLSERLGASTLFVYVSTASAVMAYAVDEVSPLLSIGALQLLQAVVRSATAAAPATGGEVNPPLNLVAHLGSTANLVSLRARIADILQHSRSLPVRRELWRLLALIASSQPALAALLLADGNEALKHSANKQEKDATTPIIELAARELGRWKDWIETSPRLLEAVLQLLSSIWLQRANLQSTIGSISEAESLWRGARELILFKTESPPASVDASEIVHRPNGSWASDVHEDVARYCYQVTCKAAALDLFASEILYKCASTPQTAAIRVAQSRSAVFKEAVEIAQSSDLVEALAAASTIADGSERERILQKHLESSGWGISLDGLSRSRPDEPFNQLYGDAFKYDGALLLDKLEGLALLSDVGTDELRNLVLVLTAVNNDLSLSTAQRVVLWAWTHFLDALVLHHNRLPWQATPADLESTMLAAFIRCAEVTVVSPSVAGYMADVNRKRVKLLRTLLKAAWNEDTVLTAEGGALEIRKDALSNTVKVVELCQRLVEQGFMTSGAELRYSSEIWASLHQDMLTIIATCQPRTVAILKLARTAEDFTAREAAIAVSKASEAFRSRAFSALGGALHFALEELRKRPDLNRLRACQDDIALNGSVLARLLKLPSGDLALLQDIERFGIIDNLCELLQRAPVLSPASYEGSLDEHGQEEIWLFAPAVLSLLLALSARPGLPEVLGHGGIMSALTANAITEALEAGLVQPPLNGVATRPLFDNWITMLQIVTSMIDNLNSHGGGSWSLSPAARFVEEDAVGFVRLYHAQILSAFELTSLSFGDGPGVFVVGRAHQKKERLGPSHLASIRTAAHLYYSLSRAVSAGAEGGAHRSKANGKDQSLTLVMADLTAKASVLLQQAVYLLQHPLQVDSLVQHQEGTARLSGEEAMGTLRDVAAHIVSAFLLKTGPELLFIADAPTFSSKRLLKSSLRTYPSEPASLGTLMDLSTHLIDALRKRSKTPGATSSSSTTTDQLIDTLEQTLALCVTQLVVILSGAPVSGSGAEGGVGAGVGVGGRPGAMDDAVGQSASGGNEHVSTARQDAEAARRELETGLGRDLKAAIKDARTTIASASEAGGAGGGGGRTRFIDVLSEFTAARLAPFVDDVDVD